MVIYLSGRTLLCELGEAALALPEEAVALLVSHFEHWSLGRALPLAAMFLAACTGSIGDPGSGPLGPDPLGPPPIERTVCDPDLLPAADLLRINRTTYIAALRSVFGEDVLTSAAASLEGLPSTQSGRFAYQLDSPTYAVVSSYVDVASAIAFEVAEDTTLLAMLSPCLVETLTLPSLDPAANACIVEFVDDLGRQLTRRPLSDEDRTRFYEAYEIGGTESVSDGLATLLMSMLITPRFLYYVEIDGEERAPGQIALTAHELAARLARVLWSAPPDEALMTAADLGFPDGVRVEVERMWFDERSRGAVREFYREWLDIGTSPEDQETLEFVEVLTFDRDATYADLFLNPTAFIESADIATRYGLDPDTRGEVSLPADQRAGVLTRLGWLSTLAVPNTNAGHIIKRGAHLGHLVCRPLPPPDPTFFPTIDPAAPTEVPRTIRTRFNEATTEPQCTGCHTRLDSLGAPFGNYGSDGEWIEEEVIDVDGRTISLPVDTESTVFLGGDENVAVAGPLELSSAIALSHEGHICFASHLTQNVLGRELSPADGCLVQDALTVLYQPDAEPGAVQEALFALLASDSFAIRSVPEAP